jgi:hypothetical protein
MAKRRWTATKVIAPPERQPATGELVNIRDLPEYRREHGLRIVRAEWPLVPDHWANGKMRPAEPYPTLVVEPIEPAKGRS